jgi:hypothetical protein
MNPKQMRMGAVLTAFILILVLWFLQHEQNEEFDAWRRLQAQQMDN